MQQQTYFKEIDLIPYGDQILIDCNPPVTVGKSAILGLDIKAVPIIASHINEKTKFYKKSEHETTKLTPDEFRDIVAEELRR